GPRVGLVRNEAEGDLHRLRIAKRYEAAMQRASGRVWPVTRGALLVVDRCAFNGGSVPRWPLLTLMRKRHGPGLDLLRAWTSSQLVRRTLSQCRHTGRERQRR